MLQSDAVSAHWRSSLASDKHVPVPFPISCSPQDWGQKKMKSTTYDGYLRSSRRERAKRVSHSSTQLTPAARDVSSATLAECLCVYIWCLSPRNASFPGDVTGSFVCPWCTLLTEHQKSWLMSYTQDGPVYNQFGYTQDRPVNSEEHRNALYTGPSCV